MSKKFDIIFCIHDWLIWVRKIEPDMIELGPLRIDTRSTQFQIKPVPDGYLLCNETDEMRIIIGNGYILVHGCYDRRYGIHFRERKFQHNRFPTLIIHDKLDAGISFHRDFNVKLINGKFNENQYLLSIMRAREIIVFDDNVDLDNLIIAKRDIDFVNCRVSFTKQISIWKRGSIVLESCECHIGAITNLEYFIRCGTVLDSLTRPRRRFVDSCYFINSIILSPQLRARHLPGISDQDIREYLENQSYEVICDLVEAEI